MTKRYETWVTGSKQEFFVPDDSPVAFVIEELKAQNAQLFADKEDARRVANDLQHKIMHIQTDCEAHMIGMARYCMEFGKDINPGVVKSEAGELYLRATEQYDDKETCTSIINKIKADAVREFASEMAVMYDGFIYWNDADDYADKLERGDV